MLKYCFILLFFLTTLYSAPMLGEEQQFTQPDGSTVTLKVFGDEFFASFESVNGYTLVQNSDGWLCYAVLNSDSTAYIATKEVYVEGSRSVRGGDKHLRLKPSAIREQSDEMRLQMGLPTAAQARNNFIQNSQVYTESRAQSETIIGLTVLIHFPNEASQLPKAEINNYLNQKGYTGYGNNGSIRDYFYDASGEKVEYTNILVEYTAKQTAHYYKKNNDMKIAHELAFEALNYLKAQGFDFSQLSTTNVTGFKSFRALNFFYAGFPENSWAKGLWPHKWALYTGNFSMNGTRAWTYQMTNVGNALRVGTFIHENGHMLFGFPDLYSYDHDGKGGVKRFCTMAWQDSRNPVVFNPYLRATQGWMNLTDIRTLKKGRVYTDEANDSKAFFYKSHHHWSGAGSFSKDKRHEYYFIENRRQKERSATLPAQGLAIWHVDESGNNTRPTTRKREVTLVQADGLFQLENGQNSGDHKDFFYEGNKVIFNNTSNPPANWHMTSIGGGDDQYSELDIRNISPIGDVMSFSLGEIVPPEDTTKIEGAEEVLKLATWFTITDSNWSTATLKVGDTISSTMTKGIKVQKMWPFSALYGKFPKSIKGVTEIGITYSADQAFYCVLPTQTDITSNTGYYTLLPPTAGKEVTVIRNISDFQKPNWADTLIDSLVGLNFDSLIKVMDLTQITAEAQTTLLTDSILKIAQLTFNRKSDLSQILAQINTIGFTLASFDTTVVVEGSINISSIQLKGYGKDPVIINGGGGNDTLTGSDGNDSINGGGGNDIIIGGGGNDIVDGGTGEDSLKIKGKKDDYIITQNDDGTITIIDKIDGRDGIITIKDIEILIFEEDGEILILDDPTALAKIVTKENKLALQQITNKNLLLSIPKTGAYEVNVYAVNGRLLKASRLRLAEGIHSVALGRTIGSGIFIINVRGNGLQVTKRLLLK